MKKNNMTFKKVPTKEVLDYIKKWILVSKNPIRVSNAKDILKYTKSKIWKILFAFVNNYGEHYLAIKDLDGKVVWFGDESDWEAASSIPENGFISSVLSK